MEIVVFSVAFVVAALCAGVMGYAIQRGATCAVAAIDEVVDERTFSRLLALVEAALWVAGGIVLARALHVLPQMPAGYAATSWTVIGGALLGLGATLNGACVFGSIARFGSGEWAYLLTPIGFYLGCISVAAVFGTSMPVRLETESPVLRASSWLVLPFAAFALWRIVRSVRGSAGDGARARWHSLVAARIWSPHTATTVIGVTFVVMLLLVGGWAYTDVLAELARGMATSVGARALLAVALLAGAVLGGWTAGRMRNTSIEPMQLVRCMAGGIVMGWGSVLLPGGNDGLVLVAMPLGWPYAWLAFATMCATIATVRIASWTIRVDSGKA
ncbi:MAG TPA: YeeE/YedE thiosulfate transporter family protein [Caldimonas sp.]|nr:YeeE/YedE thiosulfate transporter family protein [Caldimonas sp.]